MAKKLEKYRLKSFEIKKREIAALYVGSDCDFLLSKSTHVMENDFE